MQKFKKGDLIRIAKDLDSSLSFSSENLEPPMSHFPKDRDAIVIGSYADQYGGCDTKIYTLFLRGGGKCAWYKERHLTLIESNRLDLLNKWENEIKLERELKSNLDWIFENGKEVSEAPHNASLEALASCFGLTNLWGSQGEGMVYDYNVRNTLSLANSFLISGDKVGWLKFANEIQSEKDINIP